MVVGAEAAKLNFLGVLDLFGVAVSPFHGHFGICVCVYQHVERTVSIQNGEKSDRRCDLAEDGLDFFLDFLLGLFDRGLGGLRVSVSVDCEISLDISMASLGDLPGRGILLVG